MSGPPPRERVVLAHRRDARLVRTRVEVVEQTGIGDAYVRALTRSQLGLALRLAAVVVATLVAIPLAGVAFPGLTQASAFGLRVNWLVLGVALYPLLFAAGWWYLRLAERNEREFLAAVDDDEGGAGIGIGSGPDGAGGVGSGGAGRGAGPDGSGGGAGRGAASGERP